MRKHDQSSAAAEGARRATGATAERDRKGRFSARRKRATVLRLLRGEDLESVVAGVGHHGGAGLAVARQVFGGGPGRLEEPSDRGGGRRPPSAAGQDRRTPDGDRVAVCEGRPAGGPAALWPAGGRRDERRPVDLHPSGVWCAARLPRVGTAAVECLCAAAGTARLRARASPRARRCAAPDEVLVGHIRRVLEASPFHGEGYRKVWAKLRVEGIRTLAGAGAPINACARPPGPAPRRPGAWPDGRTTARFTTETPDVMWGTDMTATVTVAEGAALCLRGR